jgi:flagellar protein FliT
MNSPRPVVDNYQRIAAISGNMLDAARAGRWDEVKQLERDCARVIVDLRLAMIGVDLDPELQALRMQTLREVLNHDAEIRSIAEPGWERLAMMGASNPPGS